MHLGRNVDGAHLAISSSSHGEVVNVNTPGSVLSSEAIEADFGEEEEEGEEGVLPDKLHMGRIG